MSVRFKNAAGINLGSSTTAGLGAGAVTLAFRIRFNWPPASGDNLIYFHSGICDLSTATADGSGGRMNFYYNWWNSSGSAAANGQVYANTANHIVITYDKDDASKQALYINGARTLMASPQSAAFDAYRSTLLRVGMFDDTESPKTVDFDLEGVLWLLGYAATPDEVNAMRGGADPTTIGPGAADRNYWPLMGTPGATVGASDAGITNSINPSFASTLSLGSQSGTGLVYGNAMPYVSPVTTGDFAVYSTGRWVRVGFNLIASGGPIGPITNGLLIPPTIKINGGSPITLVDPYYTSGCAGIFMKLPDGVTVPKDAAVTITTADNWVQTAQGLISGVTDQSIPNRSGKSVYGDLMAPTMRVGPNFSYCASYWHGGHGTRNSATRAQISYGQIATRGDQTVDVVTARQVYEPRQASTPHPLDGTGEPLTLGLYAVGFDDNDPANPTDIILRSADGYHVAGVVERTEYRNDGQPDGTGKVRVYEVKKCAWTVTLAAPIADTTTTTITLVDSSQVFSGTQYTQAIKIDSEYMFVMDVNHGTNVVTVVRGAYGTTPATHANGAAGAMDAVEQYFPISLSFINNATSVPNYKNLVLYDPGDWDVPSPAAPVVLDKSDAYAKAPNWYERLAMSNGVGVVRQMDSTDGGFGRSHEPEHQRFDTDLWPGETYNFNIQAKVVSTETATMASAPYAYQGHFVQNAVKYTVTLAAPITTTPAAGTIETIQITEDPANPVFYGQRIEMPSGEVMRVLTQSGNAVSVVRGSERTTPATQAAGSVLARYRIPVPNDAAWHTLDGGRLLQTCDANHGLWSHVLTLPSSNNLNTLARINVTLAEDMANNTDAYIAINVTVALGDAQYLKPGLIIQFDDECVLVIQILSMVGTEASISVKRAVCGTSPARAVYEQGISQHAHTSGTVGTGSSGGGYFEREDGGVFAWSNTQGYQSPIVVTGPKSFVSAQGGFPPGEPTLIWNQVGVQSLVPAVDDYTCRVITVGPDAVHSWEHSARKTAFSPGADHWLNIPQYASNDLVDAIAVKIRDGLPAGQHRVLVELGNELWNQGSPRLMMAGQIGQIAGYPERVDSLTYRGWAAFKRVQAVFADHGRGSEVKFLIAWQQGGLSIPLDSARSLGVGADVDVVSTAPYFVPKSETNLNAAFDAATDEEAADLWKFDLEYNYGNIAGSLSYDGLKRREFEAAVGRSVEFIQYEGGPDSFTPTPPADVTDGYTRNMDINYNPNTYFALYDFPYIQRRVGGVDGIAYFSFSALPFWNGAPYPGYYSLWGMSQWSGQLPGRGDGSDGKADNRLTLATPGKAGSKPAWVNQNENTVSVRLQSFIDYNAAYAAYDPTPPANEDVPHRITTAKWQARLKSLKSIFTWSRVYTTPPPPHVNQDIPHQHMPTVIRKRRGATEAIHLSARPVSDAPPPPPQPDAVPVVGRKTMIRWRMF